MSNTDDFTAGGGMTALHSVPRTLPLYVAPTDADEINTIRLPIVPIACWRLNDPAFAFDSSFVSPDFAAEFTKLSSLVRANPNCPASLFGHADPVGSDAVNKTISDRRAMAVYAVLVRRPEQWEQLYSTPVDGDAWGTHAVQAALSTVRNGIGLPYYTDTVDGRYGPNTTEAVRSFQVDCGLAPDGHTGPDTRKALFGAYMDAICIDNSGAPFNMKPEDFLGAGGDPRGKIAMQGCSAYNPVVLLSRAESAGDVDVRNDLNAPNRRILVFLFRPGTQVDASEWPCPRVEEPGTACKSQFWPDHDKRRRTGDDERKYIETHDTMACRFYDRFARRSPCEGGTTTPIRIRLFDKLGKPMDGVDYEARIGDEIRRGTAIASYAVLRGVVPPVTIRLRWNLRQVNPKAPPGLPYEYEMDVFVDLRDADRREAAKRKLHNLGYALGANLEDDVRAFQRDRGLPPTGNLDEAQNEIDRRHDQALPRAAT